MRLPLLAALLSAALLPAAAAAGPADGLWRTESNDAGEYLEVRIGPCPGDPELTCGVIERAVRPDGPDPDYPHLGRWIIRDMAPKGPRAWSGGEVRAPEAPRLYGAEMRMTNGTLKLEACVLFFCRSQTWTRLE